MKRLLFLFLATLLLIPSLLLGAEQDPRTLTYPPLTFTIPASERFVLNNGMVVHLLQDHELPMVSISAYVNTGSIYEPADKVGLAGLTGAVMRSGGVKGITPSELDRQLEQMASSIEATIGSDVGNVSLSCLSRNLQPTLELFAQVMRNPAFAADRVELARKSSIEAVRRQNDDPQEVADRELLRAIYAGHPLGRVPTVASLTNISRQDMVAFHHRYFAPSNVILAVAGDVSRQDLEAQLNKVFGSWQGVVTLPVVPPLPPEQGGQVLFANKEVSQSAIRMGHRGIDKSNPDLYAVRVLEYILGGGFTSRLMTEVRSNQGLAYNVSANFDIGRRFVGTFTAETET
ncbi:MAG TPA: pitrilysin family protein, partial [Geobacterales bacterium]|nr:pitrilysin family protein [Geobacterales bacterium]